MVKMDAGTEEKAPVGGGQLLPVVGNIGFQFPIFLIYPRQGAEYLPGNMRFRTPQRATGQQILHRTIVEHAQDVPPWRKLRPRCETSIWRTAALSPTNCTS